MAGKLGLGGDMISEVNVTPMVDVMLVLLVIFMVTAPLIEEEDNEKRKVEMDIPVTRNNANRIDPENTDKVILAIDDKLIVTAVGLVTAIPAGVAYNWFLSKIKVLNAEMDNFSNDFLNIVKRHFFK